MTPAPPNAPSSALSSASHWHDRDERYGWLSILVHWLTVALIFALLFVGDSIALMGDGMMRLHTSLAICSYVFLVARAVWRWRVHHPALRPPVRIGVRLAQALHYTLLAAILLMMVTGPLMACSGRVPLRVFDWFVIPCPHLPPRWFATLHALHVLGARIILYGVLLHIAAVFKHTIWNRDGTFGRMMTPYPGRTVAQALLEDDALTHPDDDRPAGRE